MNSPLVLESTRIVIDQAQYVSINSERIEQLCQEWAVTPFTTPPWDTSVHWNPPTSLEQEASSLPGVSRAAAMLANYILVLDCLNFCFWPDPGQTRWTIDYAGQRIGGYQALAAALRRAVEENIPLMSADYLKNITQEQVLHIFRGQGQIPLLDRRIANMREVGRVLNEKYQGEFAGAILSCQGSAVALVNLLADNFSSFRDIGTWRGQEVRILKRAQITVVDLFGSFNGQGLGAFSDIKNITAFADYKIPQVLRALGILEYSQPLAQRVDSMQLLPAGSEEEIEIRVSMVWAIHLIEQELEKLGAPRAPYELDWFLWNLGQTAVENERPYHRTRTIFY